MIQQERISSLNRKTLRPGKYVLYWMQAAQRAHYNHALEYSIRRANELRQPVIVIFGITDSYPDANLRHYHFMLQGLNDVREALEKRGIGFVIRVKSPELAAAEFAEKASLLIVDAGHTRIQRKWRRYAARRVKCLMQEVETNLIVPVMQASDKENFSAGTLRPRITAKLGDYLKKLSHRKLLYDSLDLRLNTVDISDIDSVLSGLRIDRSVGKVDVYQGGNAEARWRLRAFIKNKLDRYSDFRNDPNKDFTSNMSPYLHFGHISPLYIALEVMKTNSPGRDAYLEELIVRRELSYNFVFYNEKYDRFDSLPPWARNTLNFHGSDRRDYVYSLQEFEKAGTHDPYWNAAQKEMVLTGKMQGYMRMYWGKKILEWSRSPKVGFRIALHLNNKYELDGRDPNGFAGVAWCFGKHDRAWAERKVFGKIRYMNAAGLSRKCDPDRYVEKIAALESEELR